MIRVHPGRILAREMQARNITANTLALKLRVPPNRISEIVSGRRGISPETALRLGRYFGTGAALWSRLQARPSNSSGKLSAARLQRRSVDR